MQYVACCIDQSVGGWCEGRVGRFGGGAWRGRGSECANMDHEMQVQHVRILASLVTADAPKCDFLALKRMAAQEEHWKELFAPWRC